MFIKLQRKHAISILITLILMMVFFMYESRSIPKITFVQGTYNASQMSPNKAYELKGTWLYHPFMMPDEASLHVTSVELFSPDYEMHDITQFFYGTYQFTIFGLVPNTVYAIVLTDVHSAYALYVNDELIGQGGTIASEFSSFTPFVGTDTHFFASDSLGHITVLLGVSHDPYLSKGITTPPVFGTSQAVNAYMLTQLQLISMLVGSLIALSIYYISLHFLSFKEQKAWSLGLFSLLLAIKLMFSGMRTILFVFPSLSFEVVTVINYVISMLIFPLVGLMISYLGFSKRLLSFERLMKAGMLFILISPIFIHVYMYETLYTVYTYIVLLCAPYLIFSTILGVKRHMPGAIPFLISLILLITSAIYVFFFGGHLTYFMYMSILMIGLFLVSYADDYMYVKRQSKLLEAQIITDPLTCVYNRLFLSKLMSSNLLNTHSHDKTLILFIDLDDFKQTNDIYGHDIGDQILVALSQRMQRFFDSFSYIIRYGGDEFVVLCPYDSDDTVKTMVEHLRHILNEPIPLFEHSVSQSVSIGHAIYVKQENNLEEKIKQSDAQMYLNKERLR